MPTESTNAQTAAGSKMYIGLVNPGGVGEDLEAETSWTEIGEITNIPEFGKVFTKVEHKPLAKRGTFKFKGGYDGGSLNLDLARVPADAGQAACILALEDDNPYNFKVEFNDAPVGSSAVPTTFLFAGKVFSYTTAIGTRDNVIAAKMLIEIDGSAIESPAATS